MSDTEARFKKRSNCDAARRMGSELRFPSLRIPKNLMDCGGNVRRHHSVGDAEGSNGAPGQTHWIDDVDLEQMRLRLRPAEIVVLNVSDYS